MSASKQPTQRNAPAIGHNSAVAITNATVSLDKVVIWHPAAEQAADVPKAAIAEEAASFAEVGQRERVKARRLESGEIEIVTQAHTVEVIRLHNEANPGSQPALAVAIYEDLPDTVAYGMLAQQVSPAHLASAFAKGQLFQNAIRDFGTAKEAAKHCRVSEATISKSLTVAESVKHIGQHVEVHRDISQRSAMWLIGILGHKADGSDSKDVASRPLLLKAISNLPAQPQPAKRVFAALMAAVKEAGATKIAKGRIELKIGDAAIGTAKFQPDDARVDLERIGQFSPKEIGRTVELAVAAYRRTLPN